MRIAAASLVLAFFALVCMVLAMRFAGPVTHSYNLGSLSYDVRPSFTGKGELFVPLPGWKLEAGVIDAPYTVHVEPRTLDGKALLRATKGVGGALHTAKKEIKHDAILAFVRAFLYGLAGGVVAGFVALLVLLALRYRPRVAVLAGTGCVVLTLVLIGGSALWVWQSLDIQALKRPTVTQGAGAEVVNAAIKHLRTDGSFESIIQDLAPLLRSARGLNK